MSNSRTIIVGLLLTCCLVSSAAAEVPPFIENQGRTLDDTGSPVNTVAADEAAVKSPDDNTVHWSVVASGGGQTSLGNLTLGCTLGQTAVGTASLGGGSINAGFWQNFAGGNCCWSRVGDANGSGQDEPTIGDISVMIEAKFITLSCDGLIECIGEADVNQSGGTNPTCNDITIGDISILIDYLFVSLPYNYGPLPDCL